MRSAFAPLALAALVAANPMPAGVTSAIAPAGSPPAGCSTSKSGTFEIQPVNVTSPSKRGVEKRQTDTTVLTLMNGRLMNNQGRTGYIAANHQLQFDNPPQAGAIFTSGFSVCSNGSMALGDDAIFFQCLSGNFFNLYDESIGGQCNPVFLNVVNSGSSVVSQTADGQVTGSAVASQISDGQIQATTAAVSQISDGQIQATTAAPISQISDGQIQATTGAPISQISDGQIQATTGAPISQISDGQIQATTGAAPISQISDGQIQATTGTNVSVSTPTATVSPFTGDAASDLTGGIFGLIAAGVMAVAML